MLKQILLPPNRINDIIALLKSKRPDADVYWDVYEVFHGRDLPDDRSEHVIAMPQRLDGDAKVTMMYEEEWTDIYHMYDSSTNTEHESFTRAEFLEFLLKNKPAKVKKAKEVKPTSLITKAEGRALIALYKKVKDQDKDDVLFNLLERLGLEF